MTSENTQIKIAETAQGVKPVKLTKRGLPDRRSETSKKNLEKAKGVITTALKEIKTKKVQEKKKFEDDLSSDNYSSDEEEIDIEQGSAPVRQTKELTDAPETQPTIEEVLLSSRGGETPLPSTPSNPNGPIDYTFTFEKKLNEEIERLNKDYDLKISNIEKKTRDELEYIKRQNQELKKHMTSNFRTHQGVLNQEMFLKF
jgi:hypothetical protein